MDKDKVKQIAELKLRHDVIQVGVELLNMFAQYTESEEDSDLETLLLNEMNKIMSDMCLKNPRQVGELAFLFIAIISQCSDPEHVQEFLNDATEEVQKMLDDIGHD